MSQELVTPSAVKQMAGESFCVRPDIFIVCSPLYLQMIVWFYNFGISWVSEVQTRHNNICVNNYNSFNLCAKNLNYS